MAVKKCFTKPMISENNLLINGQKCNNNLVFYRLSPEKNRELLRKTQSSDPSLPSDPNPLKKRYLVSQKSGLVYEIVQKSRLNDICIKRETDVSEPDTDLISDDQFFRYLGLIDGKRLKTDSKQSLNLWPIRDIAKVEKCPKYDRNGSIVLTDICPKPMTTEEEDLKNDCSVSSINCETSRRSLAKSQWREEVNHKKETIDTQKQLSLIREESLRKREVLTTISSFPLSSQMGNRLFRSLFSPLNELQKYLSIIGVENECLNQSLTSQWMANIANNCVSRLTRGRDGREWHSRYFHHNYSFTRTQRLEKYQRLETGLDWRSRILKSRCKRLSIKVQRITKCPICGKVVEFRPRHQCFEFEPHLRPQKSLCASEPKDSRNEMIIIGDDFVDDQEFNEYEQRIDSNDSEEEEEVIKANDDEEDDDIMIVEEVVIKRFNPNQSAMKEQLMSQMGAKPLGYTKTNRFVSLSQTSVQNNDYLSDQFMSNENNYDFRYEEYE